METDPLDPNIADRLRDTVREDFQNRVGEMCLRRGLAAEDQVREAIAEQARLRAGGLELNLAQVLLRLRLITTQQYLRVVTDLFVSEDSGETPPTGFHEVRRLGRYEILKEIGKGGIGTVYKAYDTQLKRVVALKTLRTDILPPRIIGGHLAREAQTAGRLKHRNVVTVHDGGEIEGVPYISMEYVEGTHLGDLLYKRRADLETMVRILEKAARGVAEAHREGIVHRDLKPGNILVDKDNEPRIIDFGLARIVDPDRQLALTQSPVGTPLYMSPEQVHDPKAVGPKSDVYSLGVCLYEIMTHRAPFEGTAAHEIFRKILSEDPVPPRRLRPELSIDLETICLKAMEKRPEDRFATADEFADELRRYIQGEAILSRPPSMSERFRRQVRRSWKGIAAASIGAILIGATALGVREVWRRNSFHRSRNEAQRAFAAKDWSKSLVECQRALEIRDDAALRRLAADCRERIDAEAAEQLKLQRYVRLQERLKPLEAIIRETRPLFYIKDQDVGAQLRKMEEMLSELESTADDPANARFPDLWIAIGLGWYFAGNLTRAEPALLKAESLVAEDGRINSALGRIYLERSIAELVAESGDLSGQSRPRSRELNEKALPYLRRKTSGWGTNEFLERQVGDAFRALAEDRGVDAMRLCKEGLQQFGDAIGTEEFWYLQGWIQSGNDRLECLNKAIARKPHHAWAWFLMGNLRRERAEFESANDAYTRAIGANPNFHYAYNNRGATRLAVMQVEGALEDYDSALRIDPKYITAFVNRASVRLFKGDRAGALADIDRALSLNPDSATAYAIRAEAYFSEGNLALGLKDCDKSLSLSPKCVTSLCRRAMVRCDGGDYEGAREDCDLALQSDPNCVGALTTRALAKYSMGDADGARADSDRAVDTNPKNPVAYTGRATIRTLLRDYEGAISDCDKALAFHAQDSMALCKRGAARGKLGRTREALADFESSILLHPLNTEAYNARGNLRLDMGDRKGAREDFDKVLKINPAHVEAHFNRGTMLAQENDMDGALAEHNEALRFNPKHWGALISRGIVWETKGDFKKAYYDYDAAIRLIPNHPDGYFNRGMCYYTQGRMKEAIADLEKSLRLAPADWNSRPLAQQTLSEAKRRQ